MFRQLVKKQSLLLTEPGFMQKEEDIYHSSRICLPFAVLCICKCVQSTHRQIRMNIYLLKFFTLYSWPLVSPRWLGEERRVEIFSKVYVCHMQHNKTTRLKKFSKTYYLLFLFHCVFH